MFLYIDIFFLKEYDTTTTMDELKNILNSLGLSPLWTSVIVLLIGFLLFFLKNYIDLKKKLKEIEAMYKSNYRGKFDDQIFKYSPLQVKALLEAYRMLYENKIPAEGGIRTPTAIHHWTLNPARLPVPPLPRLQ